MRYHFTPVRMVIINKSTNSKCWWACGEKGTLMWITAHGISVLWLQWTNSHGLQKSCGEKGMAWPLSKWERGREGQRARPLPGQAFIAFMGTLHWGWSSCTMNRFAVGDYLLQITKERMLLITSKRRMLQIKGRVVELVTFHTWEV